MSETIQVGNILEGKVVKVKPFGAIVLLPERKQGLVHISHISSKFVEDINDHIAEGDIVQVKVLSYDEANNKMSLSIKEVDEKASVQSNVKKLYEPKPEPNTPPTFEDIFSGWVKDSNERHAVLNKRSKRR